MEVAIAMPQIMGQIFILIRLVRMLLVCKKKYIDNIYQFDLQ